MSDTKHLTAAEAAKLVEAAAKPAGDVRPAVVENLVKCYLRAIQTKAKVGVRRLNFSEASIPRTMTRPSENKAAVEKLKELGYQVDAMGLSW